MARLRRRAGRAGLGVAVLLAPLPGLVLGVVLVLVWADALRAQPAGDARRGERQFQRCFSCHSVDPGETADLQGPNLNGVVGRKAGAVAGYAYSAALAARAAQGLVWTGAALDRFMADPEAVVPGTRMAMPGLAEPRDRADIIAYLEAAARR